MFVIVFKYLTPKWVTGIALFPFIVLSEKKDKQNKVLLNHEKIHIRQQIEFLILPFFVIYLIEFLIKYITYKNWSKAYQNISFEKEAYENEKDLNYLKKRSFWKVFRYF